MLTDKNKEDLLAAIEHTGLIRTAAREIGLPWKDVAKYLKDNPDFEAEVSEHMELFSEIIESTIIQRALVGREKPVYDKSGTHIRTEYEPNDNLLVRLAQARMPEKYGNKTELTGSNGEPLQIVYNTFGNKEHEQV